MKYDLETIADARPGLPGRPAVEASAHMPRIEAGRWMGVLRRRCWLLALTVVVALAGTWAWLRHSPKLYRSHGSVYVSTEAPRMLDIRAVAPEESRDLEQLHSVADGMLSSTLLLRVIERNDLAAELGKTGEAVSEQGLLEEFSEAVHVELRRGTRIIDIEVDDTDPDRARCLVDSIKTEYEAWTRERQDKFTEMVSEGLAAEELRLRERMEISARRLEEFRESNEVPGLEAGSGIVAAGGELGGVSSQLTRVRADRLQLEAEVEAFERFDSKDPDAVASLGSGGRATEVLALLRAVRDKQVEFARIKERYLHKHPVYREIEHELGGLEQALAAAVQSAGEALEKNYAVAVENENKLVAELARARGRAVEVDGLKARFAELVREVEADRALHGTVSKRLRETSLAVSAPTSILRWEDRPLAPEKPVKPHKKVLLAMAGCGGVLLGLLLMTGLELGDRRVRDARAAERLVGAPMLARLPATKVENGGMVIVSDPGSAAAEGFRRLRAVLTPPVPGDNLLTTLFTSAGDGEGKSLCALNHAAALALQGHRTLLIDADLRRGDLSRNPVTGGESEVGLGDYLVGTATAAESCVFTTLPKLCLLASGGRREDAAELLAGTRFPALLEDAKRWFDRVVIDLPAALVASEVQAVARYADSTCLVINGRTSCARDLERTAAMLRSSGANLAGFVWNEGANGAGEAPHVTAVRPEARPMELAVGEPMPAMMIHGSLQSLPKSA